MSIKKLRAIIREAMMDGWTASGLLRRRGFTEEHGREIMKLHPKLMQSIGVDPQTIDSIAVLGGGTKGIVYDVGQNALKVTHDKTEAITSAGLIGVRSEAIAEIYNVIEFSNPKMPAGYYGIYQEKLFPLSKAEADRFDEYVDYLKFTNWLVAAKYDLRRAIEISVDYLIDNGARGDFIKKWIQTWKTFVRHWNIEMIVSELNKNGIDFHDYHAGNLMKRPDGTYVIIDLGYSRSTSAGTIKKIFERFNVSESKW